MDGRSNHDSFDSTPFNKYLVRSGHYFLKALQFYPIGKCLKFIHLLCGDIQVSVHVSSLFICFLSFQFLAIILHKPIVKLSHSHYQFYFTLCYWLI